MLYPVVSVLHCELITMIVVGIRNVYIIAFIIYVYVFILFFYVPILSLPCLLVIWQSMIRVNLTTVVIVCICSIVQDIMKECYIIDLIACPISRYIKNQLSFAMSQQETNQGDSKVIIWRNQFLKQMQQKIDDSLLSQHGMRQTY